MQPLSSEIAADVLEPVAPTRNTHPGDTPASPCLSRYDVAEAVMAAWRIGAGTAPIPVSEPILSRALFEAREVIPEALLGSLSFSGGYCIDGPDIILAAEQMMAIQTNGTDFTTARFLGSDSTARQMAVGAGMSTGEAAALGRALKASADRMLRAW